MSKIEVEVSRYLVYQVGEVTALTWNDTDYGNKVIRVNKTIGGTEEGKYTAGTPKRKLSVWGIHITAAVKDNLKH